MNIITPIQPLTESIRHWRDRKQVIAFVPTMGNLHPGHLHLVKQAQTLADRVVVSIFVNPMQFGVGEDFERYPRTVAQDCQQLEKIGADLVWTPTVAELYSHPHGFRETTRIEVPGLSTMLCGASRPGHFVGVATIVNKLFNIVQPDRAIFGEKDYQQLLIIRKMVTDLIMPIDIIGIPTVRDHDGLALSSRNGYLTPEQRQLAPRLFQTLMELKTEIEQGNRNFVLLETRAQYQLAQAGFVPDYVTVRKADTLELPNLGKTKSLRILAAAYLGSARLIDNLAVTI